MHMDEASHELGLPWLGVTTMAHPEDHEIDNRYNFVYDALPGHGNSFRLISIELSSSDNQTSCYLAAWPLDQAPVYVALSYTWGDPEDHELMKLNDMDFWVQRTCHYTLQQLPLITCTTTGGGETVSPGYFWIDSICINQQDRTEMSAQVQMMCEIYSRASTVCASLGDHADNSKLLFEMFRSLDKMTGGYTGLHIWGRSEGDALRAWQPNDLSDTSTERRRIERAYRKFALRPYWDRLWIIRELFLAQSARLMCGKDTVSFSALLILDGQYYGKASVPRRSDEPDLKTGGLIEADDGEADDGD